MRSLNRRGDPDAVIRAFEGGHVATTEAVLGEYVKALALVDRLDNTALLQTLSVRLRPRPALSTSICTRKRQL